MQQRSYITVTLPSEPITPPRPTAQGYETTIVSAGAPSAADPYTPANYYVGTYPDMEAPWTPDPDIIKIGSHDLNFNHPILQGITHLRLRWGIPDLGPSSFDFVQYDPPPPPPIDEEALGIGNPDLRGYVGWMDEGGVSYLTWRWEYQGYSDLSDSELIWWGEWREDTQTWSQITQHEEGGLLITEGQRGWSGRVVNTEEIGTTYAGWVALTEIYFTTAS